MVQKHLDPHKRDLVLKIKRRLRRCLQSQGVRIYDLINMETCRISKNTLYRTFSLTHETCPRKRTLMEIACLLNVPLRAIMIPEEWDMLYPRDQLCSYPEETHSGRRTTNKAA